MIDYREHVKTCAPDDFWGQIKRTVGGKPVGQDQIDLIVTACMEGLELQREDVLLDLCCGNGALTRYFFDFCQGGVGVDLSEALIDVAKANFEKPGRDDYVVDDVVAYMTRPHDGVERPERFTKALCYGSFAYLDQAGAETVLRALAERYANVSQVFIGNLPDKAKMSAFFRPGAYTPGIENEARSDIGVWRTEDEFAELGRKTGWDARFVRMPPEFYAAHYRYDVVLTRAA